MILYRKEPIPLQMKNIMLLDDAEGKGVIYVNKDTYDQALLLHSRFDGDVNRVISTLKSKKTEAYICIYGLKELIENMSKTMPSPLNMLAPFLMFCVPNQGIDWDGTDREFAYGILHQFSQLVDFNAITLVPSEVRANISIPTAILKNYESAWNELCSTLEDKVMLRPSTTNSAVETSIKVEENKSVSPANVETKSNEPEVEVDEDEDDMDPFTKAMLDLGKELNAGLEEMKQARQEVEEANEAERKAKEAATLQAVENEANESASVLDEFDI